MKMAKKSMSIAITEWTKMYKKNEYSKMKELYIAKVLKESRKAWRIVRV